MRTDSQSVIAEAKDLFSAFTGSKWLCGDKNVCAHRVAW